MRAVNLLPRDAADGRKLPAIPALVGCGGTVLVTLFLAVSFLQASSSVGKAKQELADAQTRLAAIPTPPAPSPIIAQIPTQKQDRITQLSSVLGTRIAFDRILREVSQVVPSDVWLQSLTASVPTAADPNAAPSATPTGFQISGYTYSQDGVARFLARLEVVPDLTQVTLGSATSTKLAGRGVVQFSIAANLKAPGASS